MTAIVERQRARFYIQKKQKNRETFKKKSQTIPVAFLYTKSNTLYVTGFFMNFLKLAFIHKKYHTLGQVTFLYTKTQTLRKNQDNFRYVFIYKNPALCVPRFFIGFLKFAEGGDIYLKKYNSLCFTLLYRKCLTLCVTFSYPKNYALFVT